jgi:phage-related minor tail protein
MSDTDTDAVIRIEDTTRAAEGLDQRMRGLESGATGFARAMTRAFSSSITGGKQFDDILKSLTLRLSDMAVRMAFRPLEQGIASSLSGMFSGIFGGAGSGGPSSLGGAAAAGAVTRYASGGVIGTPSYFPMMNGGVGLAGEAGPEAIMPLTRGVDGRLGVAGQGGGANITIQIATPDVESFRRSEGYVAGQIARAVARGQRNL